jgi:YD repeat-containing protein
MKIFQPILALLLPLKAMACGLDWSPPVSHFENVDYQGNVHIVRKIGEVEKLPLYLIFNSTFGVSPYVGSGFELPFLEARMWQVDEGRFQAKMPTGWLWIFQRTKDPTVLEGNAGWKGVIKDDTITAWAPCGDKITFKTGRIVSMKIKEDLYSYNYRNGRVASVEKNGKSVLEIKRDAITGEVTGLALPGTWETIGLAATAERPVVESIGGKNVVSRVEKTLGEFTPASGGAKVAFEQSVNGELNPTIKLGDQLIAWNPATKKIAKDGEWTYDIKPGAEAFDNAAIGRENATNQSEFWHRDNAKGEEIVQGIDGVKKVTTWFTSGNLAGAIRKKQEIAKGVSRVIYQASYDERGKLFREILEDGEVNQFTYAENGNPTRKIRLTNNGEPKDTVEYEEGRMAVARSGDGRTTQYFYDDQGREKNILINGHLHSEKFYAPDGGWQKLVVYDQKSGQPARTFFTEIDAYGRALAERITEHSGDYPEIYRQFFYDAAGQLVKKIDSQQGVIEYLNGADGRRIAHILKTGH